MLNFKDKLTELNNLVVIALQQQTLTTKLGKVQFAKKDVEFFNQAYKRFVADPSHDNGQVLSDAIDECIANKRSGFVPLQTAMANILTELKKNDEPKKQKLGK